jgi:hypothetical protein
MFKFTKVMKKYFLITLLFFSFYCISTGQTYTYRKFPTSTDKPIWLDVCGWKGFPDSYRHYLWGMIGDTIISNLSYSKLYSIKDTLLNMASIKYYFAGIREDSAKRVYIIYSGDIKEKILFDFSKSINDTIIYNNNYYDYFQGLWNRLDTARVIFDEIGEYYNRNFRYFETSLSGIIFEGVGNGSCTFNPGNIYPDDFNAYLSCFKKNDTVIIGYYNCLQHYTNSIVKQINESKLNVFYRPLENELVVNCREINNYVTISIFDITGKVVKYNQIFCNSINRISLVELNDGIYLYRVSSIFNNYIISGKFIKHK